MAHSLVCEVIARTFYILSWGRGSWDKSEAHAEPSKEKAKKHAKKNRVSFGRNLETFNYVNLQADQHSYMKSRKKPGAKTIKKNTNSTQNKSQTHRAKQYKVTSFLSTDCELSTDTCSKNVYSLGPWTPNIKKKLG